MGMVRLDKLIADSGAASRSQARDMIRSGRVSINGEAICRPEFKTDDSSARVCIDGQPIRSVKNVYIMLCKPNGVVSATEDENQQTVIDLLTPELKRLGLFPVGRLDKDTTGLLILTNDGEYVHKVISPKNHVPKVYRAAVDGILDESDAAAFAEGVVLADGTRCMPAELEIERPSVGIVTVYEGKYHQVKRMFASRGKFVTALHRCSIGALVLDSDLKPGDFREMPPSEAWKVFERR